MRKQRFDITATVRHTQDEHIITFDTVHNHIVPDSVTAVSNAKIVVAGGAPYKESWLTGKSGR